MIAHTPGPWRIWKVSDSAWEICEPDNPRRHSHFCRVSVGNMWGAEGEANAHLIAAAPDLLEALQAIIDANSLEGKERKSRFATPTVTELREQERKVFSAWQKAHAAITKATGEQHD